ncbi:hypothetical protein EYC84_003329 [Monilinia fructicola]|uniref:Uncharacterized protein n=1 Tax=Monilinia fructicola TaxID=38448 RepID=A0A5M9JTA2_MONFR|nr:hypothetical protein EYC84_003329 [Monilinia fructicola]
MRLLSRYVSLEAKNQIRQTVLFDTKDMSKSPVLITGSLLRFVLCVYHIVIPSSPEGVKQGVPASDWVGLQKGAGIAWPSCSHRSSLHSSILYGSQISSPPVLLFKAHLYPPDGNGNMYHPNAPCQIIGSRPSINDHRCSHFKTQFILPTPTDSCVEVTSPSRSTLSSPLLSCPVLSYPLHPIPICVAYYLNLTMRSKLFSE